MSFLRITTLTTLFVALILVARGEGERPPQNVQPIAFNVHIEFIDGRAIDAKCASQVFRLEADYGNCDILLDKVRSITFIPVEGRFEAVVELINKSHLSGHALTKEILVEEVAEPLPVATIREFRVVRNTDTSLFAVIFGLVTLALMEIVLGIDNIIFLAIVAGRLPPEQQPKARRIGLLAALGTRLGLLFTLSFLLGLTKPVITLPIPGLSLDAAELSWREIILLVGGGFLIVKSVRELHHGVMEGSGDNPKKIRKPASFAKTILLIAVIDIVFSLDSVITAVGMVENLWIMVTAMVMAMGVMMFFAEPVARFVEKYPTVKVLALSFLILIGVLLVAEGLGQHIDKAYVYFAMAFAVLIEFINMKLRPHALTESIADA